MFKASMDAYEAWLRAQIGPDFVEADLETKHAKMRKDAFSFLRATYWRWAETIFTVCPDLAAAPPLLAIGDTHLENFGTWRDAEGRLVWGANDFDEAAVMPYALDIVRLGASAILAGEADGPAASAVCQPILTGYAEGLADPEPYVLEQRHRWLREAVLLSEKDRGKFWDKYEALQPAPAPAAYLAALTAALPPDAAAPTVAPRTGGTGSLGRPRFVAKLAWNGGPVLREAKGLVQSAWSLKHAPADTAILAAAIAGGRHRAVDPHYRIFGKIVVRRLSPNSRKIEVKGSAEELLAPAMLEAMGREIANCHAGDAARLTAVRADLAGRPAGWLVQAAQKAAHAVEAEYREYKAG